MTLTNGLVVMTPSTVAKTGTGSTATINSNGSVTFAACTTLSLNGVFTSSYDNYMINIRCSVTDNTESLLMRLRASGTDSTSTADYNSQTLIATSTSILAARTTNAGYIDMGSVSSANRNGVTSYLFGPYLSQPTAIRSLNISGLSGAYIRDVASTHEQSTAYDGATIYLLNSGDTTTGLVTVFGFNQ